MADGYQEYVVTPALWVRIDDRLLHGQVTVAWRQHLLPEEIWIVDDMVRADPFLVDVLRMAAPADVTVRVYSVQEAISAWSALLRSPIFHSSDLPAFQPSDLPTSQSLCLLLLVKNPQTALALFDGDVLFSHLNVGNIAPGPGSRRVFRTISLTPEHVAALDALTQRGVTVAFQLIPDDPQIDWQTVRQRHPNL